MDVLATIMEETTLQNNIAKKKNINSNDNEIAQIASTIDNFNNYNRHNYFNNK